MEREPGVVDCRRVLGENRSEWWLWAVAPLQRVIPKRRGGSEHCRIGTSHEPFARGGRGLLLRGRDPRSWSLSKPVSGCTEARKASCRAMCVSHFLSEAASQVFVTAQSC